MNSGTMMLNIETTFLLFLGFFIIATFYSSVGFGGGSSYLALLSVFAFSFFFIRSNAIICNILVVSGSTFLFYKRGLFSMKSFSPFIISGWVGSGLWKVLGPPRRKHLCRATPLAVRTLTTGGVI